MSEMTHKDLVRRLANWLKGSKQMTVVMSELHTANSETPDVIGWKSAANSILVECKTSRADFYADSKKWYRLREADGMGDRRYIAAPPGVLKPDEMPTNWGLLEVARYITEVKPATLVTAHKGRECVMLMSALRRLEIATAVYVVSDETRLTMSGEF